VGERIIPSRTKRGGGGGDRKNLVRFWINASHHSPDDKGNTKMNFTTVRDVHAVRFPEPLVFKMDGYFTSYFMSIMSSSDLYVTSFYNKQAPEPAQRYRATGIVVTIEAKEAERHFLDRIG